MKLYQLKIQLIWIVFLSLFFFFFLPSLMNYSIYTFFTYGIFILFVYLKSIGPLLFVTIETITIHIHNYVLPLRQFVSHVRVEITFLFSSQLDLQLFSSLPYGFSFCYFWGVRMGGFQICMFS